MWSNLVFTKSNCTALQAVSLKDICRHYTKELSYLKLIGNNQLFWAEIVQNLVLRMIVVKFFLADLEASNIFSFSWNALILIS